MGSLFIRVKKIPLQDYVKAALVGSATVAGGIGGAIFIKKSSRFCDSLFTADGSHGNVGYGRLAGIARCGFVASGATSGLVFFSSSLVMAHARLQDSDLFSSDRMRERDVDGQDIMGQEDAAMAPGVVGRGGTGISEVAGREERRIERDGGTGDDRDVSVETSEGTASSVLSSTLPTEKRKEEGRQRFFDQHGKAVNPPGTFGLAAIQNPKEFAQASSWHASLQGITAALAAAWTSFDGDRDGDGNAKVQAYKEMADAVGTGTFAVCPSSVLVFRPLLWLNKKMKPGTMNGSIRTDELCLVVVDIANYCFPWRKEDPATWEWDETKCRQNLDLLLRENGALKHYYELLFAGHSYPKESMQTMKLVAEDLATMLKKMANRGHHGALKWAEGWKGSGDSDGTTVLPKVLQLFLGEATVCTHPALNADSSGWSLDTKQFRASGPDLVWWGPKEDDVLHEMVDKWMRAVMDVPKDKILPVIQWDANLKGTLINSDGIEQIDVEAGLKWLWEPWNVKMCARPDEPDKCSKTEDAGAEPFVFEPDLTLPAAFVLPTNDVPLKAFERLLNADQRPPVQTDGGASGMSTAETGSGTTQTEAGVRDSSLQFAGGVYRGGTHPDVAHPGDAHDIGKMVPGEDFLEDSSLAGETSLGGTSPGKTSPGKTSPGKTSPSKTSPGKTSLGELRGSATRPVVSADTEQGSMQQRAGKAGPGSTQDPLKEAAAQRVKGAAEGVAEDLAESVAEGLAEGVADGASDPSGDKNPGRKR